MRVPHELVAVKEEQRSTRNKFVSQPLALAEKAERCVETQVGRPARGDIVEPRVIGENKDCLQRGAAPKFGRGRFLHPSDASVFAHDFPALAS